MGERERRGLLESIIRRAERFWMQSMRAGMCGVFVRAEKKNSFSARVDAVHIIVVYVTSVLICKHGENASLNFARANVGIYYMNARSYCRCFHYVNAGFALFVYPLLSVCLCLFLHIKIKSEHPPRFRSKIQPQLVCLIHFSLQ